VQAAGGIVIQVSYFVERTGVAGDLPLLHS
jgi:hypothetical protein